MGLRDLFRRDNTPQALPVHKDTVAEGTGETASAPESPAADIARLRSFPLKLALLQCLMYEDGAVLPAFTMPASLHPGAPVEDWFRGFVLTPAQVASVTDLTLARTNEVYRQVDPLWPATDERFSIAALHRDDLDLLTGLRSVRDPEGMVLSDARLALAERAIAVTD